MDVNNRRGRVTSYFHNTKEILQGQVPDKEQFVT